MLFALSPHGYALWLSAPSQFNLRNGANLPYSNFLSAPMNPDELKEKLILISRVDEFDRMATAK